MLQQITEIQLFFKGGQSGTRYARKVLFSDLDIPVTHISSTDSDMIGPVLL